MTARSHDPRRQQGQRQARPPSVRATACAVWLAAWGLTSCVPPSRPAPPEPWRPREFLIAVRGAPPRKPELYRLAARAGFRVLLDGAGPDALDLARRYGLKLAVSRIGLEAATFGSVAGRQRATDLIARVRGEPGLWGYQLGDELRERDFAVLGRMVSFVRESDPDAPLFVGMLGADAWVGPALASADYAGYAARFARTVKPVMLSYAHHPFPEKGDGRLYFENLEAVRRLALDHGLPLCPQVRCSNQAGLRALGEGELRWLVHTALAYGARGIIWSRFWPDPAAGRGGLVARDGTPTEQYARVAAQNRELRAIGPQLLELRSMAVYHTGGPVPSGATSLPSRGLIGSVAGGRFVVGHFEDPRGREHVLLVNNDPAKGVTARIAIQRPCRAAAWLDPSDGRWKDLEPKGDGSDATLELPLRPGGGKLLRLTFAD